MRIDEILDLFTNGTYNPGTDQKNITQESKKLVEESVIRIIDFYCKMENRFDDDTELALAFFNSAFIIGRMYERKLNDPNIYSGTKQ